MGALLNRLTYVGIIAICLGCSSTGHDPVEEVDPRGWQIAHWVDPILAKDSGAAIRILQNINGQMFAMDWRDHGMSSIYGLWNDDFQLFKQKDGRFVQFSKPDSSKSISTIFSWGNKLWMGTDTIAQIWNYDPISEEWDGPLLPVPPDSFADITTIDQWNDDLVVVIMGRITGHHYYYRYTPATDTWTRLPALPAVLLTGAEDTPRFFREYNGIHYAFTYSHSFWSLADGDSAWTLIKPPPIETVESRPWDPYQGHSWPRGSVWYNGQHCTNDYNSDVHCLADTGWVRMSACGYGKYLWECEVYPDAPQRGNDLTLVRGRLVATGKSSAIPVWWSEEHQRWYWLAYESFQKLMKDNDRHAKESYDMELVDDTLWLANFNGIMKLYVGDDSVFQYDSIRDSTWWE